MVVINIRKFELYKPPSGKNRRLWMFKKAMLLPDELTNMDDFAKFIQLQFGEGRFSILGNARRHKGFYRIFLGTIKNNKAVGSGKITYYLAKNKERIANQK